MRLKAPDGSARPAVRVRLAAACAAISLIVVVAGVSAAPTLAYHYHEYCHNAEPFGGTCPPDGSSTWEHLQEQLGDGYGGERVCTDAYLDPKNNGYFTMAKCGTYFTQAYGETWGYPRVWNDTEGLWTVIGIEYYP